MLKSLAHSAKKYVLAQIIDMTMFLVEYAKREREERERETERVCGVGTEEEEEEEEEEEMDTLSGLCTLSSLICE